MPLLEPSVQNRKFYLLFLLGKVLVAWDMQFAYALNQKYTNHLWRPQHMKKYAYTLMEMMIVVVVVGILGSLATTAVRKNIKKTLIKQAATEVEILSAATLQLAWDTGRWPNKAIRTNPGSAEIWNISGNAAGLMGTDGTFNHWKGPYYEGSIKDPWGNPYFFDPDYLVDGVNRIVVGSFGPNGQGRNMYDSDDIFVLLDD